MTDERRVPEPVADDAAPGVARSPERERLIAEHLTLAKRVASRYAHRGESFEDLVQVASLALVKAVDRYDPSRGVEFQTFAALTISGELKHHFRDAGWSVRVPRRIQELYLEMNAAIAELTQDLGRSPTVREIATACGRNEEDVLAAIEAGRGYSTSSLDAPGPDGMPMLEHLDVGADDSAADDERGELHAQVAKLPPRDQLVVRLRFIDELSQSEIAERLGMSQMHVSRLLRRALERLREGYDEERRAHDD